MPIEVEDIQRKRPKILRKRPKILEKRPKILQKSLKIFQSNPRRSNQQRSNQRPGREDDRLELRTGPSPRSKPRHRRQHPNGKRRPSSNRTARARKPRRHRAPPPSGDRSGRIIDRSRWRPTRRGRPTSLDRLTECYLNGPAKL